MPCYDVHKLNLLGMFTQHQRLIVTIGHSLTVSCISTQLHSAGKTCLFPREKGGYGCMEREATGQTSKLLPRKLP
jgi:hypothetical protein